MALLESNSDDFTLEEDDIPMQNFKNQRNNVLLRF